VPLQHIAYKGGTLALTDLMGGRIPIVFNSSNEMTAQHKAGGVRVLATSGAVRSASLPDVPTFKESGFDIAGSGWWGIFAPARTPAATVSKLGGAIANILQNEDVRQRVVQLELRPTGTSPEEFARIQREDIIRWAEPVRASGFKPEQ
jgi:tripartite-type tricarboxylate transporter receptor subunit TctC